MAATEEVQTGEYLFFTLANGHVTMRTCPQTPIEGRNFTPPFTHNGVVAACLFALQLPWYTAD